MEIKTKYSKFGENKNPTTLFFIKDNEISSSEVRDIKIEINFFEKVSIKYRMECYDVEKKYDVYDEDQLFESKEQLIESLITGGGMMQKSYKHWKRFCEFIAVQSGKGVTKFDLIKQDDISGRKVFSAVPIDSVGPLLTEILDSVDFDHPVFSVED